MKRKGFTLVELLAVIVILAIIALITIPIVIKTINNSQDKAEEQSILGYARAIEDDIANYMIIHPGAKYEDYQQTDEFDYKGNKVFCESKNVSSTGKLTLNNCYVSDKELNAEEKKKKNIYDYENGKVIKQANDNNNNNNNEDSESPSSTSYKEYHIGDEITVAGEQYYVIADSDSNQDYVTALKDNPLTATEINTYGGVGTENNLVDRYSKRSAFDLNDSNHSGGMGYYTSDTCGKVMDPYIYDGCTNSYNNSNVRYVIDAWAQARFINRELKTVDGYGTRLVKIEELKPIGWPNCSSNATWCSKTNGPSWVWNSQYTYWTMSQDGFLDVWLVTNGGGLNSNCVICELAVVRPVINAYKNKIQN